MLEVVEPDPVAAQHELATAQRHVESAARIAPTDPDGAFAVGYDAMRKAISAHMRSSGLRLRKGPGHHRRVGDYGRAALDTDRVAAHLDAFDELRLLRNQSQYDGLAVGPGEVTELLVHARAILAAVGESLAPQEPADPSQ